MGNGVTNMALLELVDMVLVIPMILFTTVFSGVVISWIMNLYINDDYAGIEQIIPFIIGLVLSIGLWSFYWGKGFNIPLDTPSYILTTSVLLFGVTIIGVCYDYGVKK